VRIQYRSSFKHAEDLGMILFGITKIITHQLSVYLKDKWHKLNPDIHIIFLSPAWIDEVNVHNAGVFSKRNKIQYTIDRTYISQKELGEFSVSISKVMDFDRYKDLLVAVERVSVEREFPIPVNDIYKVPINRILDVRRELVDEIYQALILISKEIDANLNILKKACAAVKTEAWFIEKEIGTEVLSRHKIPRKAQLVGRWDPDYLHYTALIFDEDEPPKSVKFMTHWRAVGYHLLDQPGRLSWIDRNTLKFIPKSRNDYRFAFKVDQGDVDFSYYYTSPQTRASVFYSHILDVMEQDGNETNVLRLNY